MKKNILNILVFVVYAFITLFAVMNHEIWADEAQVWQLCRHLSVSELFQHLHNEGHPPLTYLMMMPFAKITDNIIVMQLVLWFFMALASFVLLFFAPFKNFTKYAILLSAGFIYFLPVIARSYALIPFFVFMAAILYSKQKQHPILYASVLAIIANTHIIMFCFIFLLFIDFILKNRNELEKKAFYASLGICAFSLFVVVFQLWDTTSSNSCISFSLESLPAKIVKVFWFFFLNAYNLDITFYKKLMIPLVDIPLVLSYIFVYVLCFKSLFLNNKKLFYITLLSIGFQFFIYIFTYSANTYPTRIFTAHVILIFAMWVLLNSGNFNEKFKLCSKQSINILLSVFFIFTSYNGINYFVKEINLDYSGAKKASEFLIENIEEDAIVLTSNEPFSISLQYYLEKQKIQLISAIRRAPLKYVIWDETTIPNLSADAWVEAAIFYSFMFKTNNVYVIKPIVEYERVKTDLSEDYFNLVYASDKTIEGKEEYRIFKFKPETIGK